MNYYKIYTLLIQKRLKHPANLEFSYTENHHIIPRSIDKSKEKDPTNIVNLSAREHFIAHALLVKIYKQRNDKDKLYKMLCAFDAMSKLYGSIQYPELRYKNKSDSKLYEIWKIDLSKYIKESGCRKGENASCYGKTVYHNKNTGEIKFFNKQEIPSEEWIKGTGLHFQNNLNKIWIYNIINNEQKCIDKNKLDNFLKENPNYIKGISPTSKIHIQQYNPSEGKKWITNLELKISKTIPKDDPIPNDWLIGRITNFNSYFKKYNDAKNEQKFYHFIDYNTDVKEQKIPRILKNKRKPKDQNKNIKKYYLSKINSKKEKIKLLKEYFQEFLKTGYNGVIKKFNYPHSRVALYNAFKKYIPEEFKIYLHKQY